MTALAEVPSLNVIRRVSYLKHHTQIRRDTSPGLLILRQGKGASTIVLFAEH